MKWIGLTGSIATGKSTATQILKDMNYPVLDADEVARLVVRPGTTGLKEVLQTFGQDLLLANGELDRGKLGTLVFTDPLQLRKLEAILHPRIRTYVQEEKRRLEAQGVRFAFYDVPLLFEKNMDDQFDAIILISAGEQTQIQRLRASRNMTEGQARKIISLQLPLAEKKKRADFVIQNESQIADLRLEILSVVEKIKRMP